MDLLATRALPVFRYNRAVDGIASTYAGEVLALGRCKRAGRDDWSTSQRLLRPDSGQIVFAART